MEDFGHLLGRYWDEDNVNDREIFGHAVRERRQLAGLSLVAASKAAMMTKSTLQRVEMGQSDLRLPDVALLDAAVRADGELSALHQSLHRAPRPPLHSVHRNVRAAGHRWPADWSRLVWLYVRPHQPGVVCHIELAWGPWRFRHSWDGREALFQDLKAQDDVSVPLQATVTEPSDLVFGAGELRFPAERIVDLRSRWTREE